MNTLPLPDSEIDYTALLPETHRFFNLLRDAYAPSEHSKYPGSWLASVYFTDMDFSETVGVMQELRPAYLHMDTIQVGQISTDNFVEDVLESLMIPILLAFGVYSLTDGAFEMRDINRLNVIERIIALEKANRFEESAEMLDAECLDLKKSARVNFAPPIKVETPSSYSTSASYAEVYEDAGKCWLKFVKPSGQVAAVIGLQASQVSQLSLFLGELPNPLPPAL